MSALGASLAQASFFLAMLVIAMAIAELFTALSGLGGIFAGGDMVPAERTVTVAVGHGKKAARNIERIAEDEYRITMAVAGFAPADIAIEAFAIAQSDPLRLYLDVPQSDAPHVALGQGQDAQGLAGPGWTVEIERHPPPGAGHRAQIPAPEQEVL